MQLIKCKKCSGDMPKLRLDNYGYDFCVSCSTVTPKVGRVVVIGEGDYTATELDIVDQETAHRLQVMENKSRGISTKHVELLSFDDEMTLDDVNLFKEAIERYVAPIESEEEDLDIVEEKDIEDIEVVDLSEVKEELESELEDDDEGER